MNDKINHFYLHQWTSVCFVIEIYYIFLQQNSEKQNYKNSISKSVGFEADLFLLQTVQIYNKNCFVVL